LIWVLSTGYSQDSKPNIIYIFDPICSWCYTFNPVMEKLHAKYKDKIDFTVVAGGMITGPKVRTVSEIAEYILEGYSDMEKLSGVKFGEPYLELVKEGSTVLSSVKPCQSVVAFRSLKPELVLNYSHDLQKIFFLKGYNLNEDSTYRSIAKKYNIDEQVFLDKMVSDSIKTATLLDFKKVEEAGVSGFPTLIMRINGQVILITEGFEKLEKLEKKIDKILKQHNG